MISFSKLNCLIINNNNHYPMNEHFRGPANTSNNSNMLSQNPCSTPQATYAKTSVQVSQYDCESSTYSELI